MAKLVGQQYVLMGIQASGGKEGKKVYHRALLFCSEDCSTLTAGISEDANGLKESLKSLIQKPVHVVLNVREWKGTMYLDLVSCKGVA